MSLRINYTYPFWCNTPVHLIKHGGERRFADQVDREFELAKHNQHPYQHYIYESTNQHVQTAAETEAIEAAGQQTLERQAVDYLNKRIEEEQEKTVDGKISYDKWAELFAESYRRMRQESTVPTQDKNGNMQDFVEVRRPFIAPNNDAVSN